ncbi:MAG TPA: DUF4157 domain-containing protein [Beijerinckiaceae bacterium]|jgi:hypothetical protein
MHAYAKGPAPASPTAATESPACRHTRSAPAVFSGFPRYLQRKCACGAEAGLFSQCEDCHENAAAAQRAGSDAPAAVPPIVDEALRSPGAPLDPATRAYMEPRFGHDLSTVRVHADGGAARSARAVAARAYTVGPEVVFGAGEYRPQTSAGRSLLAHELAHVVQQRQAGGMQLKSQLNGAADAAEREADSVAGRVAAGERVSISAAPGSVIQRDMKDKNLKVPLGHFEIDMTKAEVKGGLTGEEGTISFTPNDKAPVARSDDTKTHYGTLHWSFDADGVAGKVTKEAYRVAPGVSDTYRAALGEFDKFYKNPPDRENGRMDESPRFLADLDSPDDNVRARAAVALHRLGHPRALEACLRALDDAPDPLHADRTPAVQSLIEIGEPALFPLIDRLQSDDRDTRMRAERAVQGITRRRFGFDGLAWPEGAMERWMDWWSAVGFDSAAPPDRRAEAIVRLRAGLTR